MFYVYILRSLSKADETYIGMTSDLKRRFREHNCGRTEYTCRFRPWMIVCYVAFSSKEKAFEFERYLKRSGGWRFAKRRLI
jgi:putative endonuclease